jgi:hypothetical protein
LANVDVEPTLMYRINKMVISFCPSLNCVESLCSIHSELRCLIMLLANNEQREFPYTGFDFLKPTKASSSFLEGNTCSDHCFRHRRLRVIFQSILLLDCALMMITGENTLEYG